jgi:hypothetical protein
MFTIVEKYKKTHNSHPIHNTWTKDLTIKPETMKNYRKIWGRIQNIRMGKNFSNKT